MCATITRVPSTMMPKSSAPRLKRLAGMPVICMQRKANSRESGMVSAVRSAARTNHSTISSSAPLAGFSRPVCPTPRGRLSLLRADMDTHQK
jgi:hypothetical protein